MARQGVASSQLQVKSVFHKGGDSNGQARGCSFSVTSKVRCSTRMETLMARQGVASYQLQVKSGVPQGWRL